MLRSMDGMTGMSAADKSVGPAIALKVSAGDTVSVETWVRYENKVSYNRNITLASLASFLGSSYAYKAGFEAFNVTQTATSFNGALATAGFMGDGSITDRPFAYLNYMVFNSSMVMVTAGWQRADYGGFDPGQEVIYDPNGQQIDPEVGFGHLKFDAPVPITQDGYIYVWVSNESEATKVWFDDLRVTHSQKMVVQSSDYGVWGDLLRKQTTDETIYRYGYQGQFAERDTETGWDHFELREYDPVVGRWTSTDPEMQYYSPFIGLGNDPISGIDRNGGVKVYYSIEGRWEKSTHNNFLHTLLYGNQKYVGGVRVSEEFFWGVTQSMNPRPYTGELTPFIPNFWGANKATIDNAPLVFRVPGQYLYGILDDAYVTAQPWNDRMHLDRSGVTNEEAQEAFVGTVTLGFGHVGPRKILNASQFSSKFKGTWLTKGPKNEFGTRVKAHNESVRTHRGSTRALERTDVLQYQIKKERHEHD